MHLSASSCYSIRQNELRQKNNDLFEHEFKRIPDKNQHFVISENSPAIPVVIVLLSLAINTTNKLVINMTSFIGNLRQK